MTIPELKSAIDILELGERLGISIDKTSKRAKCPFHDDKTPSLQFSKDKQIATCFSSNCDAGTMDVVNLVEKKLSLSTHEACKWLKDEFQVSEKSKAVSSTQEIETDLARQGVVQKAWRIFEKTMVTSPHGKPYLESRGLNWQIHEVGYNNGVFHRGENENYQKACLKYGLLNLPKGNSRGYNVQGNYSVVFPLKNKEGVIVDLYYRVIDTLPAKAKSNLLPDLKHFYLKDRQGLYPEYPNPKTESLILTESIIDTTTLKEHLGLPDFSLLACFGTNGLTREHEEAIGALRHLREIIFWFDADAGGRKAITKYAEYYAEKGYKVSMVNMPEGEDVNSMACSHDDKRSLLQDLLNHRQEVKQKQEENSVIISVENEVLKDEILDCSNPNKLRYQSLVCDYVVRGGVRRELDSLRVSLVVSSLSNTLKSRVKVDLYEDKQTVKVAGEIADRLQERADLVESDLYTLTDLLEEYRDKQYGEEESKQEVIIPMIEQEKCIGFLKRPNLIYEINNLIGKAGVVGEENNRIFLFGIATSYKMKDTLHALIQGSSGSGKTHLLNTIMGLMPDEDCESLTRVTESSFYNYDEFELTHKLIGIEDFDGLEEKAQLAFRELQSKGMISSSTSGKNEKTGDIKGYIKKVYGPIASLSATTQGEVYEDNMSRCFLVAVDESKDQTLKIIDYQNNVAAGVVKRHEQKETRIFLQNCVRLLKNEKVINPYANQINLPPQAHKIRRLNDLFQSYVRQITLINQYQRQRTSSGELITAKEDVITAIEIMFESILLKVDELDGSLRQYYEQLKDYVKTKGNQQYEFSRIEIRQALNISKTQQHRYMEQLIDLEYIRQEGHANRGYKYKIAYWDNNEKLRTEIREYLLNQVQKIKVNGTPQKVMEH